MSTARAATKARAPSLGLWSAIALVVGNMIGSGMFLLPASLAPFGGISLIGWAISIVGAMALAWHFADMAGRFPRTGGPYVFARAGLGDGPGFAAAWCYWVSTWTGNAAIAVAFAGSVSALWPPLGATPWHTAACAMAALWLCTAFNLAGVRSGALVQNLLTVLKILPLLAICVVGMFWVLPAANLPFNPQNKPVWDASTAAAALTLWALVGFESATVPADEVRDPARTVPRATLLGFIVAGVVTVLACTTVLAYVPLDQLATSPAPFAAFAERLWGGTAGTLMAATAAIACLGTLNGLVMLQGQALISPANDGLAPRVFGLREAHGTPRFGLIVSSVLATGLIAANANGSLVTVFNVAILMSTAASLVAYALCVVSAVRLELRAEPARQRPWQPALALVALAFVLWALYGAGRDTWIWGGALLLAGAPIYAWQRRQAARPSN